MSKSKQLIILTTGKEDRGGRATIAFALAATSQAMGVETTIYLTLNGTFWAKAGSMNHVQIQGFEPLAEYHRHFMETGGRILVCPACTEFYCPVPGSGEDIAANYAGLVTVATEALESSVITF